MANPVKGEVAIEALGQKWTAVLNTNARCEMEAAFGCGFAALVLDAFGGAAADELVEASKSGNVEEAIRAVSINRARRMQVRYLRGFLFHALAQNHPSVTINDVGFMIDELGVPAAMEIVGDLLDVSSPQPEEGEEGNV